MGKGGQPKWNFYGSLSIEFDTNDSRVAWKLSKIDLDFFNCIHGHVESGKEGAILIFAIVEMYFSHERKKRKELRSLEAGVNKVSVRRTS